MHRCRRHFQRAKLTPRPVQTQGNKRMTVRADRGWHSVSVRALLADSTVTHRHSSDRPLLHHLDEALAEALVVCRNKRHGDEPPPSQAHDSLPLHLGRSITLRDRHGDDELPSRQRSEDQNLLE